MPYPYTSKYPKGFSNGVEILGTPVLNTYSNNVYWVCATEGSDGNKGTRDRPFATLSKAVSTAADDKGDLVYLKANHRETITDALNINKRGLTVTGVSVGRMKPVLTLVGAAATDGLDVSAANVTLSNFELSAGFDGVVGIDVDATNCTVAGVDFRDSATDLHFLHCMQFGSTTDNVCDGMTVQDCSYYTATDSGTSFINSLGITYRPTVVGNTYMVANTADTAGQFIAGTAGDQWEWGLITDNHILVNVTATDTYPFLNGNVDTDNTGIIARNWFANSISNTNATNTHNVKALGFRYMQNYNVGADLGGGVLWPTATEGS